ncbi:dTDP-4-dehydrorhamnose reductase [Nitrosomonas sp. Nm166]|uniref:dTDP-4-dehydrorhamnose reductase n=1 Tax=Nitrosomonas sp. Nm166 TaxID=1881054 RepID=UPI0008E1CD17|nr:dTDP-4-dehydrorhamnose reductase [Nitrosomonas sp. Nm166]SFD89059.1 dTDP-4-dehydrorhamnose reductase [Nitrosomonas sp. Nm166]
MKILLLGRNGQVGWELQRSLAPLGELIALSSTSKALCGDLTNLTGIKHTIRKIAPDIIVNAAAYTAVDKAESETESAHLLNAEAPGILAQEAKQLNARLVHYSTDYVFNGNGDQPHFETDATDPLNVYGRTKLEGEKNIIASGCSHLIFRTSWVYAAHGNNFIKTILRLAQQRDKLTIVNDQIGSPTGAELIADITAYALLALKHQPEVSGLYHLVAKGYTSWYEFARFILKHASHANFPLKIQLDALLPIASRDFPLPAERPLNSRLNTGKLEKQFDLNLPAWQAGVSRTLTEILSKEF